MLTIQVLDAGGTHLHRLEDRSLLLGSGEDVDLRLQEAGVSARHARIEPIAGGFKIVDLDSAEGTLVNGESVAQWRLQLGDRIELGRAVLVVGQEVARKATAQDVLDSPMTSRLARSRRQPTQSRSKPFVIAAVVVGLVLCVWLAVKGDRGDALPSYAADVERNMHAGKFDDARRVLALLRSEWVDSNAVRAAKVDELADEVERFDAAFDAARAEVMAESATKTRAQQLDRLRAIEREAGETMDGRIARLMMSRLADLRLEAEEHRRANPVARTNPGPGPGEQNPPDETPQDPPERDNAVVPTPGIDVEAALAEARALQQSGDSAGALLALDRALGEIETEDAGPLRELRAQVRDVIIADLGTVLGEARERAATARPNDLRAAISLLEAEIDRFARTDDAAPLEHQIDRLRESLRVASAQPAESGDAADVDVFELVDAANHAEARGAFADAALLIESAIAQAGDSNSESVDRWRSQHADRVLLAALERYLVGIAADAPVEFVSNDGARIAVSAVGDALHAESGDRLDWTDLEPGSLLTFATRRDVPREAMLGAVVLAYRLGAADQVESVLARGASRTVPTDLSAVIARGRGDGVADDRGFMVEDGRFVAVREVELRKVLAKVERRVAAAVKHDRASKRTSELEKILAEGPEVVDSVVLALNKQWGASVAALENHKFRRQWDRIADLRRELDRRRESTIALIFDTETYFAPYKPPAVSGARYAIYLEVQKDVDLRVESVREVWEGSQKVRVPQEIHREVERIHWIGETLAEFGQSVDASTRLEWVEALPSDGLLTVQSFCWNPKEKQRYERGRRIEAFNAKKLAKSPQGERRQVEITNEYRVLLGRLPLAVNPKLIDAARGHAAEMADLGYFSHYSPTAGRETPFDRMRLAGYQSGIAENLAMHSSAASAHEGWTHSSGHHRNLLNAGVTELGVGNRGRYWVQKFGGASEFEDDQDY